MKMILANILNPISDKRCDFIYNGALVFSGDKILFVGKASQALKKFKKEGMQVVDCSESVLMPSFFDMHFHWVQDNVRIKPKTNLLSWLEKYTFPVEMKFAKKSYAKSEAKRFFKKLYKMGTLGGACYSSIHKHALDYAQEHIIGDFTIGNVLMTMNSPKKLTQTEPDAVKLVRDLSKKYGPRYALTPRFAITTHPEVMKKSAIFAEKNKSYIQTHLSETTNEIDFVLSIYRNLKNFKKIQSYTDIYQQVNILGPKTLLGHGIYLSPREWKIIKNSKSSIIHCPTSNAPIEERGLGSGFFDFKSADKFGVKWAMGSDIGGGPYLSMFDVIRSFVEQNKRKKIKGATHIKGLYRSTLAGAQLLSLDKSKGNLQIGKEANFILVKNPNKVKKINKQMNAEGVLEYLIKPYAKRRNLYKTMVKRVFFKGEEL